MRLFVSELEDVLVLGEVKEGLFWDEGVLSYTHDSLDLSVMITKLTGCFLKGSYQKRYGYIEILCLKDDFVLKNMFYDH